MTKLFRNDSPGALTREQAVELEKKRIKERKRQVRELAAKGRGGDTEIAHVALGELVIPAVLQTPELIDALRRAAADSGIPFDRLRVGSRRNSINPNTGAPEFRALDDDGMPGIEVRGSGWIDPWWDPGISDQFRRFGAGGDGLNPGGGGPAGDGGAPIEQVTVNAPPAPPVQNRPPNFRAPQPYVYNGPPTEEVVVTGTVPTQRLPLYGYQRNLLETMNGPATRIGQKYGFNPDNLLGLMGHESGWFTKPDAVENNNPFGVNYPGTAQMRKFDDMDSAFDYWGKVFGPHLSGKNTTDDFVKGLRNLPAGPYNSKDQDYDPKVRDAIDSVKIKKPDWLQGR